jgi:hypothetical protein
MRRAKAERRTMSAFIEILIERYLKEHPMVQAVPSLNTFPDDNDEEP